MAYHRLLKPKMLVFIPLVLLLVAAACGEDATPTAKAPAFATSKVNRLVVAISPPAYETFVTPNIVANINYQDKRPVYDLLISTDRRTAAYEPQLATSWQMSSDARTWTFELREDIPFHYGFGEFTAKDVVHSWEMYTRENSLATFQGRYKSMLGGEVGNFEVQGDHKMVWHLETTEPDLVYLLSTRENYLVMASKAQWDEGGDDAWDTKPSGTGPFRLVERNIGSNIVYERVEDHWRHTPEFKELEIRFLRENATRMAAILADEVHISELSRDLYPQVLSQGMARAIGVTPPTAVIANGMGLYYSFPDEIDDSIPWMDIRVREAMNHAINKQEIIDTIFGGYASLATHQYFHPTEEGWDPAWTDRFEAEYGYDPDKARQLLAEAGYPNGFEFPMISTPWGLLPEMQELVEAMSIQFKEVGITANIVEKEFSLVRPPMNKREVHGWMLFWPPFSLGPPGLRTTINFSTGPSAVAYTYVHPYMDERFEKLRTEPNPTVRDQLQREIGEQMFSDYCCIPIAFVHYEAIYNPEFVAEYNLPGTHQGFTHLEYVRAAELE